VDLLACGKAACRESSRNSKKAWPSPVWGEAAAHVNREVSNLQPLDRFPHKDIAKV